MFRNLKNPLKIVFVTFLLTTYSAHAADYINNDVSSPFDDVDDYNNVTIVNSQTLSSGTVLGAYMYLGGTVDGNVSFSNSGSITSTHLNYGVLYMPNVGNTSSIKTINIENDGSLISTGGLANTIYIIGKTDLSIRRSFAFTLNNTDTISSALNAINIANGTLGTATITNSGTITGNIVNSGGEIDIVNNAGTIDGNITLGNLAGSSVALNGGSVTGNVILNNDSQVLTFNSGTLNGTVNGAGGIAVTSNTVTNGHIGASTSLTSITVAANTTFNALTNNNSISATNIILNSGSILSMGDGALTGAVDGSGANRGTVNMTFTSNADINATIGSNIALAAVNIILDSSAQVRATRSINASEVTISGIDGALTLDGGETITGNVIIGDRSNLLLSTGSAVNGKILAEVAGSGTLQINGLDHIAADEIGTTTHKLGNVTVMDSSTLTTSYALRANTISINSNSTLTSSSIIVGDLEMATASALELQNGTNLNGDINSGGIVGEGTVNTSGSVTIAGEIGSMGGIDEINVQSGSTLNIGNNDSSGNNTIEVANLNITGQLNLTDETTINGDVTMLGSLAKINANNNNQTINGNFTTSAGSQLMATIHSSTAADKFIVTGIATIDASTKLNITISTGATVDGSSYVIVDGGSGSSISAISNSNILVNGNATNRFGRFLFSTSVDSDNLLLSVIESVNTVNVRANQSKIYDAVLAASVGSSGALYELQEYLYGTASDAEKEKVLDSALPQIDNSTNRISFNVANESLDLTSNRINQVFARTENNDLYFAAKKTHRDYQFDAQEKEFSFWSQIFGSNINQGNTGLSDGYNANIRGLAFGLDKKIESDLLVGISGSYASANAKSINALKQTDINSYQINLYSGHDFENFYVNNLVGFVWSEYKSNRNILVANANASANYSGQNYIARSQIGFDKKLPENFVITPSAMITGAHNVVDNYSETGSSNANLAVKNKSTNFFEVRAGVDLSNKYLIKKLNILPNIFISYGYDLAGAKQKTSANFIGQSSTFDSTSSSLSRGSLKTGFAAKVYKIEELSFDLNYTYEKRISYHANSLGLKASYKF